MPDHTANAPAGRFRGETLPSGARVWRGIRYAEPPTGDARWRDPRPAAPADGVVDAVRFGAAAPQNTNPAIDLGPDAVFAEDCLFLNVWSPADAEPSGLPVMVWVHGGAYTFGSGSQPLYDGEALAARGTVIVTINYRIGALGFLDLSAKSTDAHPFDGNLALKDVLCALEWVRENIASFGGDPERVTVFGESAGAGLVATLLAVPRAEGLFSRAIAESSPVSSVYDAARAASVTDLFLELVGEPDPAALRDVAVDRIVQAGTRVFAEIPARHPGTIAFGPVIDGDLLPEAPDAVLAAGRGLPVPLLIGTNHDESSLFRMMKSPLLPIHEDDIDRMMADLAAERPDVPIPPKEQILQAYEGVRHREIGLGIARDIGFRMPTLWAVEGHARRAPVWLYRFDHATPMLHALRIGATHATELPYVWGTFGRRAHDLTFRLGGRRTAEAISHRMQQRWVAFAAGEEPNADTGPAWPAFDAEERATLVIDTHDRVVPDLDGALRAGWGGTPLAFP
ncbi:carboxylesterase/lipase family protein [Microbacterium sp. NPDC077184]|uniref:carboxylesterase/lipase family protein n=1 Tax=Microbacterium sp. NPDC077184 TaxID=3154764 RepID=UPI00342583CE